MFNAAKRIRAVAGPGGREAKVAIVDECRRAHMRDKVKSALGDRDQTRAPALRCWFATANQYAAVQVGILAPAGDRRARVLHHNSEAKTRRFGLVSSDVIHDLPNLPERPTSLSMMKAGSAVHLTTPTGSHREAQGVITDLEEGLGDGRTEDRLLQASALLQPPARHYCRGCALRLWSGSHTEMLPKFDKERVWNRSSTGRQDVSIIKNGIMLEAALNGMSEIAWLLEQRRPEPRRTARPGRCKPLPKVLVRLIESEVKDVTRRQAHQAPSKSKGPNVKPPRNYTSDGWFINRRCGTATRDGPLLHHGAMTFDIIKTRACLKHRTFVDVRGRGGAQRRTGRGRAHCRAPLKPDNDADQSRSVRPLVYERISRYKTPKCCGILDKKASMAMFLREEGGLLGHTRL
ncbi:hypothetical protein DL89DRAFT_270635 [Linderina pennispora]|uniref:Uncharacterized protein n=1 Tax=Linderina pennispora TaxID=61395 RepID=A0A1Y1VWV6_9FUNG|nr:uncharacterized protein DL89DRAFT_270635 [Linderina pennispora]ORX65781.1 hypothetical protein DL89DRAFT_270635 [Linderina pennispora]